jgi:NAD-dependent deacetylase
MTMPGNSLRMSELAPMVVLTGAGISAASGVPTFRGPDGLWESHRAQDLATPEAFRRDPELVWRFYAWRRQLVRGCHPNRAHALLAQLENEVSPFTLVTQNVDGLHQRAGNKRVIELHGSLWKMKCIECAESWDDLAVPLEVFPPTCPRCDRLARPDVIWFGEALDPATLSGAWEVVEKARVMLVVGTSVLVQPAASLPLRAKEAGVKVLEFNLDRTPLTSHVEEFHRGPASETLPAWWSAIQDRPA